MCPKPLQSCPTLCNPMDCIAHQAPLSMGFSGINTGVGCPLIPILTVSPFKNHRYILRIHSQVSANPKHPFKAPKSIMFQTEKEEIDTLYQ